MEKRLKAFIFNEVTATKLLKRCYVSLEYFYLVLNDKMSLKRQ